MNQYYIIGAITFVLSLASLIKAIDIDSKRVTAGALAQETKKQYRFNYTFVSEAGYKGSGWYESYESDGTDLWEKSRKPEWQAGIIEWIRKDGIGTVTTLDVFRIEATGKVWPEPTSTQRPAAPVK